MRLTSIVLALALAGCRGSFEIPPQPTIVEAPPAASEAVCSVRAVSFHGLVTVPCISLAERIRP